MNDQTIFDRINDLSRQEEELWKRASSGEGLDTTERERLDTIKVQLDQAYDLLHQRQAKRSAGVDPEGAKERPPEVVERYQQ